MADRIKAEHIADWLNHQWKHPKQCPICDSNNWHISEEPVEVRPFHGGNLVVGGPVYPYVSITCKVCGHALFFNAVVMGVVKREEEHLTLETAPEPLPKVEVG